MCTYSIGLINAYLDIILKMFLFYFTDALMMMTPLTMSTKTVK